MRFDGSGFVVYGLWFMFYDLWFIVEVSWFMVLGLEGGADPKS